MEARVSYDKIERNPNTLNLLRMKQLNLFLTLLLIGIIPITSALASEKQDETKTVEQTVKQVDVQSIDTTVDDLDKSKKAKSWKSKLPKFSGYLQAGYLWDKSSDVSTFKVNRLRLILTGDISKTFDYKLQAEGFSNSVDGKNKALVSVQDAFIRAKFHPSLYVQVGQFPISLSIENFDISPATLEFVNFSSIVNKMVCRNAVTGFTHYGRDAGVMLSGSFLPKDGYSLISYNLNLFNGSQLNQTDNNKSKDIVGRLTVQPHKNFRVSGSMNWGEYYKPQPNIDGVPEADVVNYGRYVSMTRYVVGAFYQADRLTVRGEFGQQKSQYDLVDETMYYVMAGYNVCDKITPLVRYDVFDNSGIADGKETNLAVGILYKPIPRLRVQANYTYSIYQMPTIKDGQRLELMVTGLF